MNENKNILQFTKKCNISMLSLRALVKKVGLLQSFVVIST